MLSITASDGIRHPPQFPVKTYGEVRSELQTGDIVLFSGATSSGALIKIFDGAIFSHVGLVRANNEFTDIIVFINVHLGTSSQVFKLCVSVGVQH